MNLYYFLYQESKILNKRMIFMLIFSGLSTGLLVSIINHATNSLLVGHVEGRILFLYLATFFLYVYTQKYVLTQTLNALSHKVYQLRLRIIEKILNNDSPKIAGLTTDTLHHKLVQEFNFTTQLLPWISYAAQASIIIVFCLIYLAWLSLTLFILVLLLISIAIFWHLFIEEKLHREFMQISDKENNFSHQLANILPKISLTATEKIGILKNIKKLSEASKSHLLTIDKQIVSSIMSTRMALFLLLAIFVFVLPMTHPNETKLVFNTVGITFFIMGPITQLIYALPMLIRLDTSFHAIYTFEAQLES